jgi:hypothetical protein
MVGRNWNKRTLFIAQKRDGLEYRGYTHNTDKPKKKEKIISQKALAKFLELLESEEKE